MYVLQSIPEGCEFEVVEFPKGSRDELDKVVLKAEKFWSRTAPSNCAEWLEFEKVMPKNDSVLEYVEQYPEVFYVPLLQELFAKILTNEEMVVNARNMNSTKVLINELPIAIAQPVVTWSNRGSNLQEVPFARVLEAPVGSNSNLEAAMVEHNKPIMKPRAASSKKKTKTSAEKMCDLFGGYLETGGNLTFAEYAEKMKKDSSEPTEPKRKRKKKILACEASANLSIPQETAVVDGATNIDINLINNESTAQSRNNEQINNYEQSSDLNIHCNSSDTIKVRFNIIVNIYIIVITII
jgi:hypothetical protein